MSSRRNKFPKADAFGEERPSITMKEAAGAIYDDLRQLDRQTMRAKALPLTKIRPDPVQPRRGMPEKLRIEWLQNPDAIEAILDRWLESATGYADQVGRPHIDPVAILTNKSMGDEDGQDLPDPDPVEANFLKLLFDAATVYDHGLEHPISVVKDGDLWRLESGERRTLMHWALVHWVDAERWSRIPAVEVESRSVWRQAAENNARQDLNAIERARQLALLLMDCYVGEREFVQFGELTELEFYRQAVDLRVPRGRSGDVLAAMGLSDTAQIRRFRQLLSLPEEAWFLADELNWAEGKLRGMMQRARATVDDPEWGDHVVYLARVEAGIEAAPSNNVPIGTISESGIDSDSVPVGTIAGTEFDDDNVPIGTKTPTRQVADPAPPEVRAARLLAQVAKIMSELGEDRYAEAVNGLRSQWINEQGIE